VAPLESGEAFEVVEGREVWHPMWKGKIDKGVNAQFIKAAADRIWDNEQVSICILSRGCILIFHNRGSKPHRMGREKSPTAISRCQRSSNA
jgi:hypothetical protein